MKIIFILIALCAISSMPAEATAKDTAKILTEEGNALYSRKAFDQALKKYDLALSEAYDYKHVSVIYFNRGTVFYMKRDYAKAIESFIKALATDDIALQAKTNYNIGNAQYRLGELYVDKSIDRAIEFCQQALHYYKLAIELDAGLPDAVYNYEFVKKKLDYFLLKKDLGGKEDEFRKQQEKLKPRHEGQDLQDRLDDLNQQQQQAQQDLNQQQQQAQQDLNQQQQQA
jgi:Ca-activated chloride channel homolog